MFARKIRNRSGSVSVQLIQKDQGRYRVVRTVGTTRDPEEVERFWQQAEYLIHHPDASQGTLFTMRTARDQAVEGFLQSLSNASIRVIGPELIFGALFERIGLQQIPDELFRHLVLARLAYPSSKLKTVDYLYRYKGLSLSASALYASLDRLHSRYQQQVETLVYQHTRKRVGSLLVVFYDLTTLYFEAEDEDDLRKVGFSKDGKHQHPQILLGLLVAQGGLPIGYDFFEGNTFEGYTLLPMLEQLRQKYSLERPVVVADAALLSRENLAELVSEGYPFILGARIKNECGEIKEEILQKARGMKDQEHFVLKRRDGTRLLVSYSEQRARKDARNRQKGLLRLEKKVRTGRLTKASINNRGYNKFLLLEGEVKVRIDENKVAEDQRWDGLKGYLTNTSLRAHKVIESYSQLWQIEKAFRISKTDLRIRPIYHYRPRRIAAHLCIAFAAYAIHKELEGLLKKKGIAMSAQRAGELTQTMYELHYTLPDSQEPRRLLLTMDEEQQQLYQCVHGK